MDNPDQNSKNKSASSHPNLNLPALTKEFSDQLSKLDLFSNNSHKQFQELLSISDNLSKSLSKLTNIVSNSSKALETISSTKDHFSSIKDKISADVEPLQSVASNFRKQLNDLIAVNNNITSISKSNKLNANIPKQDFDKLLTLLDSINSCVNNIKTSLENFSLSQGELLDTKLSPLKQSLTQLTNSSIELSNKIQGTNALVTLNQNSTSSYGERSFLLLVTVILLSLVSQYYSCEKLEQVNQSLDSIDKKLNSIQISPTPTITPKAEKKP